MTAIQTLLEPLGRPDPLDIWIDVLQGGVDPTAILHFTDSDEANRLIAEDPMALLIGFALDQHRSGQTGNQ